ncbi:MAG TPA: FtsX-like permease family protein, partial [Microbacterium sp.]|nr:FtsX-like permease family protein [Microbacterium sp.]
MSAVTAPASASSPADLAADLPRRASRLAWLRDRGMGATVLVAAISTAFGVLLLAATGYIGAWLTSDPYLGGGDTVTVVIGILSVLLVGVAVYVASIVTANTFATIVAGRARLIALMRLIGASARSQRSAIARQGLIVGALGAAAGLVGGIAVAFGLRLWADAALGIATDFRILQPVLLVPAIVVALTTWVGAWVGS